MAKKWNSASYRVQVCFDVGDNHYYQAILFNQLFKEFRIFFKAIKTNLSRLEELEADSVFFKDSHGTLASEIQKLKTEKNLSANFLIIQADPRLTSKIMETMIAIRGCLLAYHYFTGIVFPKQLARSLKEVFICKTPELRDFVSRLSLDVEDLFILQANFKSDDSQFKFLSSIIKALEFFKKEVVTNEGSNVITTEPSLLSNVSVNLIQTPPNTVGESVLRNNDLLRYHMSKMGLLSRKQNSGINNLYQHYHSTELSFEIKAIYKDYLAAPTEAGLCFLLCFFFRVHVSRLNMLSFKDEGTGIWLDIDRGHFCWNRTVLIESQNEESVVRIPLPIELASAIRNKHSPEQKKLSDIFTTPLNQLKKEVRSLPWQTSKSSHKPFLTRLYSAYGRYILGICKDENYATAITADFTLGLSSNFNYLVLKAERINAICRDVYQGLGFSGDFMCSLTEDVGSMMGEQSDKAIELIKEHLKNAIAAYSSVHNRSKFQDLEDAHNKIVSGVVMLLVAFLGLRKAREYSAVNHTVDFDEGLALVTDKASTTYLSCRLVPIPSFLINWLTFYKAWLQSLSGRLSGINKKLALDVDSLTNSGCGFGSIPLFFYFDDRQIKSIGSKHIGLFLRNTVFASNFGRHLIDKLIRDEAGSVLINAFCGRASLGQEAFGERSGLSTIYACHQLRKIIDTKIEALMLPDSPRLTFKPNKLKHHRLKSYRSNSWRKLVRKKPGKFDERCPFHELTLLHRNYFQQIAQAWFSRKPNNTIGTMIISLVLCDGVLHIEELTCAVRVLLGGSIYRLGQMYFIDVNTDSLGIRRVQLSSITVHILSEVATSVKVPTVDISSELEPELTNLLSGMSIIYSTLTVNKFLEIAQDYYAVYLPGPLREWTAGRLHSRTLYPVAFARHRLDLSEMMSDVQSHFQNRRKIKGNALIHDLLKSATDQVNNQSSNQLRLSGLAAELKEVLVFFESVEDRVLAKYIHFLCTECAKIKSPRTVESYYFITKSLLAQVLENIDDEEDLFTVDWVTAYTEYATLEKYDQETRLSAINYFFRLYGLPEIKRMVGDVALASRAYIDSPNSVEVKCAIEAIQNSGLSPWEKQAAQILSLMGSVPLRSEDVIHLRVLDLVQNGEQTCIVVTHAAGGTKKSQNADRVLFLSEDNASALKRIRLSKLAGSEDAAIQGLFKAPGRDDLFGGTEELLETINWALKMNSGSSRVSPHSLRGKVLTDHYLSVLKPKPVTTEFLQLRNRLYEISAQAGHADPNVTIKNYIHCFDTLRRQWVNHLVIERFRPNAKFISGLLGIRLDAAAKKIQRHFEVDTIKINNVSFRQRIEDFSGLLQKRKTVNVIRQPSDALSITKLLRFLYFREKTNDFEAACFYADISDDHFMKCNFAFLSLEKLGVQHEFVKGLSLNNQEDFKLTDALAAYFKSLDLISFNSLLLLMRTITMKSREWCIEESGCMVLSEVLLRPLRAVGVSVKLTIPKTDGGSELLSSKFYDAGFIDISRKEHTKFPRKGMVFLSFYNKEGFSKDSRILNKLVGLFVITLLMDFVILTSDLKR